MKYAVLFPGQGSQKVGMGLDLVELPIAKGLFDKTDKITGQKTSEIFLRGPESELNQTKNTQPSIVTISVLLTLLLNDELKKKGIEFAPSACCGHSLGEFTALWLSGLFSIDDLIKIVSVRGSLMQNAPAGAMAAVLNITKEQLQELFISEKLGNKVIIANYNTPTQLVISGEKEPVELLVPKIKSLGGKAILLPVSGAFHSPLMELPSKEFNIELDKLKILSTNLNPPIFQNVDGEPSTDILTVKEKIKKQMTSSVLWTQTINNLSKAGIKSVIEIGPGKVLTGLVKKINPEMLCYNIDGLASLNEFVSNYQANFLVAKK